MRVIIQRVKNASVEIEGKIFSSIQKGLLIFIGIEEADNEEDIEWISRKIVQLRIFNDDKGVMNLSVQDVGGQILLVSQFTLHALTKKGNRPSYINAASPAVSISIYEKTISILTECLGKPIATGKFGADMKVNLLNDGPVTIFIDSKNRE